MKGIDEMRTQKRYSFSALKNQKINFRQEIRRYIILLVIPLFFCVILYFSVQNISYKQYKLSAEHTVEQFQLQISSMMHEVNLISDSLVSDFIALDNNTGNTDRLLYNYSNPSSICRQISIQKEHCAYIDRIYFISEKQQYIFSDGGYFNLASLESILKKMGIDYDSFFAIEETEWNMMADSHLGSPYCIAPFRSNSGEITGYLLISLDLEAFIEAINSLNADFACLYNDATFIPSQPLDRAYTMDELASEATVSHFLGKPVKCFQIVVDDFTYMIAISKSSYYYPFRVISLCFFVYAVLVFVLSFLYLYRVSKKRYIQIARLVEALPQEDSAVTYKELIPAVQNALLSYRDQNKQDQNIVREHLLHGVLYSQYKDRLLERQLQQLQVPVKNASYYVAVFYIKAYNNMALVTSDTEDVSHMSWIIFQTAVRQFTDDAFGSLSCTEPDRFITIFYTLSDESAGKHVMAACESISKFMNDGYGIQLHAAISNAVTAPEEIAAAFSQAQSLERFAVAIDNTSKIISEDILHDNGGLLLKGDFFRQVQTLVNTLLIGKYNIVPSMAASILQEHVAPFTSDYQLSTQRLNTVAHILAEFLLTVDYPGFDAPACGKRLIHANSISELNAAADEIFAQLALDMSQKQVSFKEVDNACVFIQEHLNDQNLNVSMICESVGIIVQRLTPMFQEQLSMGIAEYVNYRRIEEAKKLLADTRLTVKQIAVEIGYSTTDTLTRNFRKLENMTPTEYRKIVS